VPHSRRSCRTALVALGVCTLGGWRGPCPDCPYIADPPILSSSAENGSATAMQGRF